MSRLVAGSALRGPVSLSDNNVPRSDGTSGLKLQSSLMFIDDAGGVTGTTSIVMGNVTWNTVNLFSSTSNMDFTSTGTMTMNTGGTGNFNMISFGGSINAVAQVDVQFASATGVVDINAATDLQLTAGGSINLLSNTEIGLNSLSFGSSNEAKMAFTASGLYINPKVSGATELTIGSAPGTNDADLLCNKLALFGSAIGASAVINCVQTGAARQVINLVLTYNGSTNSAANVVNQFIDSGSNASMTALSSNNTIKLLTTSHTTVTHTAVAADCGIDATIAIASGTYTFYGVRTRPHIQGVGSASTSGGTFRRYGLFQDSITAIAGAPGSDLIMGAFFNNSINLVADNSIIFDSTSTALGDTSLKYVAASTDFRVTVDGTQTFIFDADKNISKFDLKLDVVGSGLYLKEGTNATMGTGTLVAGVLVVNTTKVTANSRIFLTNNANAGTVGSLFVTARTAGTSFTVNSTSLLDTSTFSWMIVEPA